MVTLLFRSWGGKGKATRDLVQVTNEVREVQEMSQAVGSRKVLQGRDDENFQTLEVDQGSQELKMDFWI